jgi:hypothetical protein
VTGTNCLREQACIRCEWHALFPGGLLPPEVHMSFRGRSVCPAYAPCAGARCNSVRGSAGEVFSAAPINVDLRRRGRSTGTNHPK